MKFALPRGISSCNLSVLSGIIQDNRCNFSMANLRVETKGTYPILSLLESRMAMADRNNI